jgi:hypothetical protein
MKTTNYTVSLDSYLLTAALTAVFILIISVYNIVVVKEMKDQIERLNNKWNTHCSCTSTSQ